MIRWLSLMLFLTGSSLAWGADAKENLQEARSHYRQAVAEHGPRSPEARQSRHELRERRKVFHAERRERQHGRRFNP